ncbi:MAG: hypothetical protein QF371_02710, partial [Flavobacteriales bacterium]|nr:hypothetical protein [Flavobacteriales bacterium]
MLIRLLRDKGLLPFFATILLGVGLLAWGFVSTDQNSISNELLISHWAFGWLHESGSVKLILGLVLAGVCA